MLRYLTVEAPDSVHDRGVRLHGAHITGDLDFADTVLARPLVLDGCTFISSNPIDFHEAAVPALQLSNCAGPHGYAPALNLRLLRADGDVNLNGSHFTGIDVTMAAIRGSLSLNDSVLQPDDTTDVALQGQQIRVHGNVLLAAVRATGAVSFLGAEISGVLDCRSAHLQGTSDGTALLCDALTVGKSVFLTDLRSSGAISLDTAEIAKDLFCDRARLLGGDENGYAVSANRVRVGGSCSLQTLEADGAVDLQNAEIHTHLLCGSAKLRGTDTEGTALRADGINVGRLELTDLEAAGAVSLIRAKIDGAATCGGIKLRGADKDHVALCADGMETGGLILDDLEATGRITLVGAHVSGQLSCANVKLHGTGDQGDAFFDGLVAHGTIRLHGARIDGQLRLSDVTLKGNPALLAFGMHVGSDLHWYPAQPVEGLVNLERVHVHKLADRWHAPNSRYGNWPPAGQLRMDGFVYDQLGDEGQPSTYERLEHWIRHCHYSDDGWRVFATQPYEQFATVLRRTGHEGDARRVAIHRRSDLRRYGSLGRRRRATNWLLDVTIKHGYKPIRAVGLLTAIYLLLVAVMWGAQHQSGLIVASQAPSPATNTSPTALHCVSDYPCFYPAGYAFDAVVPIIKLDQASNWRINANAPWGTALTTLTWVSTVLGWALATLAVAGFTGIIHKD